MKRKIFIAGFLFLMITSIPILLLILRNRQETRSRASSVNEVVFSFNPSQESRVLSNETFPVKLMMNTNNFGVEAIDLTISFNKDVLELTSVTSGDSIPNILTDPPNNTTGTFHYVGIGKNNQTVSGTAIEVATLIFKTKTVGTASIGLASTAKVASISGSDSVSLASSFEAGSITVASTDACQATTDRPDGCACTLPSECASANCSVQGSCIPAIDNTNTASVSGTLQITSNGISYDKVTISACKLDDQNNESSGCHTATTKILFSEISTSNQQLQYNLTGLESGIKYRVAPDVWKNNNIVSANFNPGIQSITAPATLNINMSLRESTNPTATPIPSPTTSPIPTATIFPTPTVGANDTYLKFGVRLTSADIGTGAAGINGTPHRPQRIGKIDILNSQNTVIKSMDGTFTYSTTDGAFWGIGNLGPDFATGQYLLKVKFDNTLTKLVPGIITINKGANNYGINTALIAGDLNNDNELNLTDYTIMIACIRKEPACTQ